MNGEPKYATRRNPNNPTFGARIAAVAAYLGGSLMPWQRQVADVALELDPNDPGAWRYPVVVITVPRQAGKSFLLRAVMADRLLTYNNHEILMTAQTGKDARKRWKQLNKALGAEKKSGYFRVYASQGSERTEYLKRGSFISPFAPTPKSIHGDSLHLVTIDEAWAFDAESGLALETAINPTQLTIQDSQLWIVSTKGTDRSAYLNELIRQGRQEVNNPNSRMCFFEWSADEAAAEKDPYSDETLSFHPAIGHTQTADKIRALKSDSLTAWRRSILNLETATDETVIDMTMWADLQDLDAIAAAPDPSRVCLGVDLAADRSGASIAAAWLDNDGDVCLSIVASGPGTDWVPRALTDLQAAGYQWIGCDPAGPTRTLAADLENDGHPITTLGTRDYATACQLLLDRAKAGRLVHDGNQELTDALAAVVLRRLSGVEAFDAPKSPRPIDALRAAAAAVWAACQPRPGIQIY